MWGSVRSHILRPVSATFLRPLLPPKALHFYQFFFSNGLFSTRAEGTLSIVLIETLIKQR